MFINRSVQNKISNIERWPTMKCWKVLPSWSFHTLPDVQHLVPKPQWQTSHSCFLSFKIKLSSPNFMLIFPPTWILVIFVTAMLILNFGYKIWLSLSLAGLQLMHLDLLKLAVMWNKLVITDQNCWEVAVCV